MKSAISLVIILCSVLIQKDLFAQTDSSLQANSNAEVIRGIDISIAPPNEQGLIRYMETLTDEEALEFLKSFVDGKIIMKEVDSMSGTNDEKGLEILKIDNQLWMNKNLEVTTFRNGDIIPQAQSDEDWEKAGFQGLPAWCYYNLRTEDSTQMIVQYGKLYNSFALNDPRGLAPEGWHIPSVSEWEVLVDDSLFELIKIDSSGISSMVSNETNTSKLSIYPAGWRDVGCGGFNENVSFWASSSEVSEETPYVDFYLDENQHAQMITRSTSWIMGFYVRCVKNE